MTVPRIDGLDKVLGRKVYARDLRSRDLEGWPAETKHAFLLRAELADRPYQGIDDERIPENLRPKRRVTAAQLAADKIRSIATFGSFWLVPEGKFPDHIGQPVAIFYYDSYFALVDFVEWLRHAGAPLRYGAQSSKTIEQDVRRLIDPLLAAVEREPAFDYGSVHYVRLSRDGTEEFSHVKDGGHDPTAVGPEVPEPDRKRNRALPADCDVGGVCDLPRGQTLSIPLGEFVAQLGSRRQLLLSVINVASRDVPPSRMYVAIDGQLGAYFVSSDVTSVSVHFEPFPEQPTLLEVRYDEGTEELAPVRLVFHDFACEEENAPEEPCAL